MATHIFIFSWIEQRIHLFQQRNHTMIHVDKRRKHGSTYIFDSVFLLIKQHPIGIRPAICDPTWGTVNRSIETFLYKNNNSFIVPFSRFICCTHINCIHTIIPRMQTVIGTTGIVIAFWPPIRNIIRSRTILTKQRAKLLREEKLQCNLK